MKNVLIRDAKCIDNNDPLRKGRVKLRIFPEFIDMADDSLPWCYPFAKSGNGISKGGTHQVPENGEFVKALVRDKYWKKIEYLNGDYVSDNYPYTDFSSIVSRMVELGNQNYPQPTFIKEFVDGTILFHNSATGETGIYHKSGSYYLFDTSGNIIQNTGLNKLSISNQLGNIYDILKNLNDILTKVITPGSLIGNLGIPVQYLNPTDIATLTQNLAKIQGLFKS